MSEKKKASLFTTVVFEDAYLVIKKITSKKTIKYDKLDSVNIERNNNSANIEFKMRNGKNEIISLSFSNEEVMDDLLDKIQHEIYLFSKLKRRKITFRDE